MRGGDTVFSSDLWLIGPSWKRLRVRNTSDRSCDICKDFPISAGLLGCLMLAISTAVAVQFRFPQQQYFVTQAPLFDSAIEWLQHSHETEYIASPELVPIDAAWRSVVNLLSTSVRFTTAQWIASLAAIVGAIGAWRDLAPNSKIRMVIVIFGFLSSVALSALLRPHGEMVMIGVGAVSGDPCGVAMVPSSTMTSWAVVFVQQLIFVAATIADAIVERERELQAPSKASQMLVTVVLYVVGTGFAAFTVSVLFLVPYQSLLVGVQWATAIRGALALIIILGVPIIVYCCYDASTRKSYRVRMWDMACGLHAVYYAGWLLTVLHLAALLAALVVPFYTILTSGVEGECPPWLSRTFVPQPGDTSWGRHFPFGLDPANKMHRDIVLNSASTNTTINVVVSISSLLVSVSAVVDAQSQIAERRKRRVEDAAAAMGQAIAYISHEARGPLNAAALGLALLDGSPAPPRRHRHRRETSGTQMQNSRLMRAHPTQIGYDDDDDDSYSNDSNDDDDDDDDNVESAVERERVLLHDVETSVEATRRHLDDLMLWENAGLGLERPTRGASGPSSAGALTQGSTHSETEDIGASGRGGGGGVWAYPADTLLQVLDRGFRAACRQIKAKMHLRWQHVYARGHRGARAKSVLASYEGSIEGGVLPHRIRTLSGGDSWLSEGHRDGLERHKSMGSAHSGTQAQEAKADEPDGDRPPRAPLGVGMRFPHAHTMSPANGVALGSPRLGHAADASSLAPGKVSVPRPAPPVTAASASRKAIDVKTKPPRVGVAWPLASGIAGASTVSGAGIQSHGNSFRSRREASTASGGRYADLEERVMVFADFEQLVGVLNNGVSNAIKHSRCDGTAEIVVLVSILDDEAACSRLGEPASVPLEVVHAAAQKQKRFRESRCGLRKRGQSISARRQSENKGSPAHRSPSTRLNRAATSGDPSSSRPDASLLVGVLRQETVHSSPDATAIADSKPGTPPCSPISPPADAAEPSDSSAAESAPSGGSQTGKPPLVPLLPMQIPHSQQQQQHPRLPPAQPRRKLARRKRKGPPAARLRRGILQLEVRDNGRGISDELIESGKLFQPFARLRQGDDSLKMASSGLGLAIVRSIVVDGCCGEVGMASKEDEGALMYAQIPVWMREDANADASTESARKMGRSERGSVAPPRHRTSGGESDHATWYTGSMDDDGHSSSVPGTQYRIAERRESRLTADGDDQDDKGQAGTTPVSRGDRSNIDETPNLRRRQTATSMAGVSSRVPDPVTGSMTARTSGTPRIRRRSTGPGSDPIVTSAQYHQMLLKKTGSRTPPKQTPRMVLSGRGRRSPSPLSAAGKKKTGVWPDEDDHKQEQQAVSGASLPVASTVGKFYAMPQTPDGADNGVEVGQFPESAISLIRGTYPVIEAEHEDESVEHTSNEDSSDEEQIDSRMAQPASQDLDADVTGEESESHRPAHHPPLPHLRIGSTKPTEHGPTATSSAHSPARSATSSSSATVSAADSGTGSSSLLGLGVGQLARKSPAGILSRRVESARVASGTTIRAPRSASTTSRALASSKTEVPSPGTAMTGRGVTSTATGVGGFSPPSQVQRARTTGDGFLVTSDGLALGSLAKTSDTSASIGANTHLAGLGLLAGTTQHSLALSTESSRPGSPHSLHIGSPPSNQSQQQSPEQHRLILQPVADDERKPQPLPGATAAADAGSLAANSLPAVTDPSTKRTDRKAERAARHDQEARAKRAERRADRKKSRRQNNASASASASAMENSESSGAAGSASTGLPAGVDGQTVYVVDDERVNRQLTAMLLRRWGFRTRQFEHGGLVVQTLRAGLKRQRGRMPRIMTLDVEMPVLGGKGVLQAMQEMVATASITGDDISATASALSLSPGPRGAGARVLDSVVTPSSTPTPSRALSKSGSRANRRTTETMIKLSEASKRLIMAGLPAVIVVTGNARTVDRDELLALGAVTVLAKPIDPDQFASLLTALLALSPSS